MRARAITVLVTSGALLAAACSNDNSTESTTTSAAPPSSAVATSAAPTTSAGPSSSATSTTAPADDGTLRATIRRTTDGVPHISGDSFNDVVYGQGYANAEDYACTLLDAMQTPLARRAATFGPGENNANVESDFAWQAIGLDRIARADYATAPARVTEAMESYVTGWNQHLDEVGAAGLRGWCTGQPWVRPITADDLYVYARWISLQASSGALARYIPSAHPPTAASGWRATHEVDVGAAGAAFAALTPPVASNAWAVGSEKVTGGHGGMLIANPHFPWEGSLRFWEVQLTVPGEINVYGAMLIGVPGVGIGFTDHFAWSHTVSAGHRFTGYLLTLDPADPTKYMVDGVSTPMTPTEYTVDVQQPDGRITAEKRTLWASEYGPIVDFPGVGWSATQTLAFRDANLGNDEFVEQYFDMDTATSFDAFVDAHRRNQGVPLFNTIAVSSDGRAWYADTSATPKLSAAAEAKYLQLVEEQPLYKAAGGLGVILLDGSDSTFRWEEVAGARDPGLVPFDEMPMMERRDYVFNANDSFWMAHPTVMLDGDYSIMHGPQRTERSLRTRENAMILSATGTGTPAGPDGTFTAAELRTAALYNQASSATLLRAAVVGRCTASSVVEVAQLDAGGTVALPAESVNLATACKVLEGWDGIYDNDSSGAVLWHEFLNAVRRDVPGGIGGLWLTAFDPAQPLATPNGLAPAPIGQPDPVVQSLARAVQTLTKAGRTVDIRLGELQYALRATPRIPIHGGPGPDGLTNVVDFSQPGNTTEPLTTPGATIVSGSDLRVEGYPIDRGTSFLMNVDFTGDTPAAWAILTYGETEDRSSPLFTVQTQRFSDKDWRQVAYTDTEIDADPALTTKQISSA